MPRNRKDDDFFWYLLIGIIIAGSASSAEPQELPRPDASQAKARAIIARADSAAGRIGGRSRLRYSHMISETQAPTIKTVTEVWTMTPNRVLTRITMQGAGTVEVGYNGTVGWTTSPFTGPVLLEGEPLKELAKQAQSGGRLDTAFKTLSAGLPTVVEGKDVVPVMLPNGEMRPRLNV